MFFLTTINLSPHVYPDLVTELLRRWPECEGRKLAREPKFFYQGKDGDPKLHSMIEVIESMGYGLGSDNYKVKPPKRIPLARGLIVEDSDYDKAELIRGVPEKTHNEIDSFIRNGRLKINKLPPKFNYCFFACQFLITEVVKRKLEEQSFIGIRFLSVDHVPGNWTTLGFPERYVESTAETPLSNLYCLLATQMLPAAQSGVNPSYSRDQIFHLLHFDALLEFRITEGPLSHRYGSNFIAFSNRFYSFWKSHFGEVRWKIIEITE